MARVGPPDEVLVVAAILGDFGAFNELVVRYRAAVVRTARSIVGQAEAEDVAQEALLLAFKALPGIEDPTRFAAWLMAITRNRAFRVGQQRQRQPYTALDTVVLAQVVALSQPLVEDDHQELREALDRLPAPYQLALRLHFLDGMPLARIAAFLGVPLSTVKWRIHEGKKRLREALNPRP